MSRKGQRAEGMLPMRIMDALKFTGEWMSVRDIAEFLNEDKNHVHGVVARLYGDAEIDRRMHWVGKQRYGKPYIWQFRTLEVGE